jgi:vacuolar-type H+-ATPase subunit F/Vma7
MAENNEGKVAILGQEDFVMPFSALGADTYAVSDISDEIAAAAREVAAKNYTLIVLAENIAAHVEEAFEASQQAATPCIVVVPFTTESTGFANRALGEVLKMATGINILQEN